jgi:ArsR family transcriptional regulator, lead/cadmium/zinc/bismuth-responsive transcriptional repressor
MVEKKSCNLTTGEAEVLSRGLPVEGIIRDLSDFLKVFGDPTRIRIIFLLRDRELCVHDIGAVLNMQQAAISHQLKILRQARLVRYRKEGKMVFYTINDRHISELLQLGLEHIEE